MTIFQTSKYALFDALSELDESSVRTLAGSTIFKRGESYYASGAIEDISYTDMFTIEATVSGSDFYAITLTSEDGSIDAECDCPFDGGGICKHVVAVLLEAINEGTSMEGYSEDWENAKKPKSSPPKEIRGVPLTAIGKTGQAPHVSKEFQRYVESLSKTELQELIFLYAPQEFRQAVLTHALGNEDAAKVVKSVEKAVDKIFANEYLRHNNKKLEAELMTQLERLRGVWEKFPKEIATIIAAILLAFNEGFEEGDFYDEDNYDYGFMSKKFDNYVLQFLKFIPEDDKTSVEEQIYAALSEMSFSNFEGILKHKREWQ